MSEIWWAPIVYEVWANGAPLGVHDSVESCEVFIKSELPMGAKARVVKVERAPVPFDRSNIESLFNL